MSARPPLLDVSGFDRSPALSAAEREALIALGWDLRRGRCHDADRPEWTVVTRLVAPLDAARLAMRDLPESRFHVRSALDAVGLVLHRCADRGTTFWTGRTTSGSR